MCYLAWVPLLCLHCFGNQDFFRTNLVYPWVRGFAGCLWNSSLYMIFIASSPWFFSKICCKSVVLVRAREALNVRFSFIVFWAQPFKNSYNPGFDALKVGASTPDWKKIRITLGSGHGTRTGAPTGAELLWGRGPTKVGRGGATSKFNGAGAGLHWNIKKT